MFSTECAHRPHKLFLLADIRTWCYPHTFLNNFWAYCPIKLKAPRLLLLVIYAHFYKVSITFNLCFHFNRQKEPGQTRLTVHTCSESASKTKSNIILSISLSVCTYKIIYRPHTRKCVKLNSKCDFIAGYFMIGKRKTMNRQKISENYVDN